MIRLGLLGCFFGNWSPTFEPRHESEEPDMGLFSG